MKQNQRNGFVQTILFISIVLCSCREGSQRHEHWRGKIVYPGEYDLTDGGYKILVTIDSDLVRYSVLDAKGATIIRSNDNISAFQTWALYWDSARNLWVQSSDIGDAVWRTDGNGSYKKEWLMDSSEKEMPVEIRRH